MAVLYTAKQIQDALKELRIKPVEGKVTGREAARILTWRAQEEQGIEHSYPDSAIRQHAMRGNLQAYPVNRRFNLYKVEDVFEIALSPKRGLAQQKDLKETAWPARRSHDIGNRSGEEGHLHSSTLPAPPGGDLLNQENQIDGDVDRQRAVA